VEFKSREWIQAHVDFTRYVNAREGAWAEGFADGKYTDDTEMTLGLVCTTFVRVVRCRVRRVSCVCGVCDR
jgi:ADP-ribosylglycohydrolase